MSTEHKINVSMSGCYSISTRDIRTNEKVIEKCVDVDNVVTLDGKHLIVNISFLSNNGYTDSNTFNVSFSTGTTEVLETDTALSGTIITTSAAQQNTACVKDNVNQTITYEIKRKAVFSPGSATGTFGQVGFYGGSTFIAGQILRDTNGDPTTLTFLDNEEVTVYYSIFVTWPFKYEGTGISQQLFVGSFPVDVKGVQHTCNMYVGGSPYYGATRAETDGTRHSAAGHRYAGRGDHVDNWVYAYSDTIDGPLLETGGNGESGPGFSTITHGVRYKRYITRKVLYTRIQDKYIKYLSFCRCDSLSDNFNFGSISRFGTYYGNDSPFILEFEPRIFKGAGDEINISPYYIIEIA